MFKEIFFVYERSHLVLNASFTTYVAFYLPSNSPFVNKLKRIPVSKLKEKQGLNQHRR